MTVKSSTGIDAMPADRDPVNTDADSLSTAHPTHPRGPLKWIVMIDSIW